MEFAAQGYASNFCLSIFDRFHKPDMSIEEVQFISPSQFVTYDQKGVNLAQKCIAELNVRFLISQPNFVIKVSFSCLNFAI